MKLREVPRQQHHFMIGDIVQYRGARPEGIGCLGIVLNQVVILDTAHSPPKFLYQECECIFAAREFELYLALKEQTANQHFYQTPQPPRFCVVKGSALTFIREAPKSWFANLTIQDIQALRFKRILDE